MKTSIIKKLLSFALLLLMLQTATAMDFNAGV